MLVPHLRLGGEVPLGGLAHLARITVDLLGLEVLLVVEPVVLVPADEEPHVLLAEHPLQKRKKERSRRERDEPKFCHSAERAPMLARDVALSLPFCCAPFDLGAPESAAPLPRGGRERTNGRSKERPARLGRTELIKT